MAASRTTRTMFVSPLADAHPTVPELDAELQVVVEHD